MTLFVSYFTGDLYRRFGERMKASVEKLGLECVLAPEKDRGDWYANRAMMPQFILDQMNAHPWHEAVCWLDADALMHKRPELLLNNPKVADGVPFDVAGYPDAIAKEVFWAVLYFRSNDKGRKVLTNWIGEVRKSPLIPHHGSYRAAVKNVPDVRVELLPVEYCCIRRFYPACDPVIENQAISRQTPEMREELLA